MMNDDKTPLRPEGAGSSVPRVEVEPTPQAPQPTSHIPVPPDAADTQAGTTAHAASPFEPTPTPPAPDGFPEQPPLAPQTETVKHTVVKTRTKKLPVFVAALAGLVVGAVLVIALVMAGAFRISDVNVESTVGESSSQVIDIDPEDVTLSEVVAAKALPSVVSISAMGDTSQSAFGVADEGSGSIGSGVILDKEGHILTNHHVIEGAGSIVVTLDSGESLEAELVGEDASSDLAVVRIKDVSGLELTPIEIGDSDSLTVGEWVMAIGSPFGNEQSVSTGVVSALYRSTALPSTSGTSIYANMIQTDAAINPGNSGGALVNDRGQLIGINSVIESYSGSSSGVGFAIPVNYAANIAEQIIAGETPVHPYLGVTVSSVNALTHGNENAVTGAQVMSLNEGSPAAEAGIETGDVITELDGEPVSSADGLIIALREHEVGDRVKLTVLRDGKTSEIDVVLGSDEALQNAEEQDGTEGDGSGSGMTEEEFLRYLEELLGRGGWGR